MYVAEPEGEVKGFIVIVPDAFGWDFINNRVLADIYASKSDYRVYLPDFMNGYSAPVYGLALINNIMNKHTWTDLAWKPYYIAQTLYAFPPFIVVNRFGASWPRVQAFFSALRTHEASSLPLGAAGFCWGGKHIMNLAHAHEAPNGKPLVDAVFTAHPSNLAVPAEIEPVRRPVSIAMGDRDFVLSLGGTRQIETIFNGIEGLESEVVLYPGAGHGFAIRADPGSKDLIRQAKEAEEQAVNWFKRCFSKLAY